MSEEANEYDEVNGFLPQQLLLPSDNPQNGHLLSVNKKSLGNNSINGQHEQVIKLCQRHECSNGNRRRIVSLIRTPPVFKLSPPPNPLLYLDINDLYNLDVSLLVLANTDSKDHQHLFTIHSKLDNQNRLNEKCKLSSPIAEGKSLLRDQIDSNNEERYGNNNNQAKFSKKLTKNLIVNNMKSAQVSNNPEILSTNSTHSTLLTTNTLKNAAIAASSASPTLSSPSTHRDNNYLSFFLLAAFSIITVLLIIVCIYVYLSR